MFPQLRGCLQIVKSQKAEPLVTAFVTIYNSERFLRGALEELEAQTIAKDLEIIIIETGSPGQGN